MSTSYESRSDEPRTSASLVPSTATIGRLPAPGLGVPPWNGTKPPKRGGALASAVSARTPVPLPPTRPTDVVLEPRIEIELTSLRTTGPLGVGVVLGAGVGVSVTSYVEPTGISALVLMPKIS